MVGAEDDAGLGGAPAPSELVAGLDGMPPLAHPARTVAAMRIEPRRRFRTRSSVGRGFAADASRRGAPVDPAVRLMVVHD
jgi:hypothetical protein